MRTYKPEVVNAIAARIPDMGGYADFTDAVLDAKNIFLHDGGVAACIWSAPRVYECHLFFPPECRGRFAVTASKRMGDYMMTYHAEMLWAQPAASNKAAIWLGRQAGFDVIGNGYHSLIGAVVYMKRGVLCHQQ